MRNETLRLVLDYRVPEYRLLEEAESRDLNWQLLIGRVMTDRMGYFETMVFEESLDLSSKFKAQYRHKSGFLLGERMAEKKKKEALNDLDVTFQTFDSST